MKTYPLEIESVGSDAYIAMSLGARVKHARDVAGLTQSALAEMAGISQVAISEIERGESARTAYLPEISRACGADIYWLAFGDDEGMADRKKRQEATSQERQELSFCLDGMGFSGMPLERVASYITALSELVGETAMFVRMTDNSIVFVDDSSRASQNTPEAQ